MAEIKTDKPDKPLTPEQDEYSAGQKLAKQAGARVANVRTLGVGEGNVYSDYSWGINGADQDFIKEIPVCRLIEYQATEGPLLEDLKYTKEQVVRAYNTAKNAVMENQLEGESAVVSPYLKIYSGALTQNIFQLPFFNPYNHMLGNSWGEANAKEGASLTAPITDAIKGFGSLFQRGLIEKRRVWKGSTPASYSFTFHLYNTFNPMEDIPKNYNLVRTLIYNNLPDRTSFATMLPPCYYTLQIPGVRYAPIVVLNISVQNIGQLNTKSMDVPDSNGEIRTIQAIIPDAYEITVNVTELHNETREIYDSVFDYQKVNVVNVVGDVTRKASSATDIAVNQARGLF